VTALALDRPMCLGCLVEATDATTRELEATIASIGRVLTAHESIGRCSSCRDVGWVCAVHRRRRDGRHRIPIRRSDRGLFRCAPRRAGGGDAADCVSRPRRTLATGYQALQELLRVGHASLRLRGSVHPACASSSRPRRCAALPAGSARGRTPRANTVVSRRVEELVVPTQR